VAANVVLFPRVPQNLLARFEGALQGREREKKGKKESEKERTKKDGRDGRKHPKMNIWLRPYDYTCVCCG